MRPELKKRLGLFQGLGFALTLVVGSGVLALPGMTIAHYGATLPLQAWLLTIVAFLPLVYIFVRLGVRFPEADGMLRYAEIVFGERGRYVATLFTLGTILLGVPFSGYVCAAYLQGLPGLAGIPLGLVAIVAFLVVTAINVRGVKMSGWVNYFSVACIALLAGGIVFTHLGYLSEGARLVTKQTFSFADLSQCSLLIFWAFIGWEELSFGLEEFRDSEKNIPRVYWMTYVIVALLYVTLALTASGAHVAGVEVTGAGGLRALIPESLQHFVALAIAFVALANVNSNVFVYSRMAFAGARAGILPASLARLSRNAIPTVSILSLSAIYCLVIAVMETTATPWSLVVHVVDQNFIVLYWVGIFAFVKTERSGVLTWLVAGVAFLSSLLFLSHVSWRALYPVTLILLGLGLSHCRKVKAVGTALTVK